MAKKEPTLLTFPENISETGPFLKMEVYEYPTIFDNIEGSSDGDTAANLAKFLEKTAKSLDNLNDLSKKSYTKKENKLHSIGIYIPADLGFVLNSSWEKSEILGAKSAIGSLVKNGEFDSSAISSAATSIIGKGVADVLSGAGGLIGKVMNEAQLSTGLTLNPKERQMFRGTEPMSLDLSWEILPQTEKEAISAEKIVEVLRKSIIPKIIKIENFLKPPNIFNFSLVKGGKGIESLSSKAPNMLSHARNMVLKSLNIKYINDNSVLFYDDDRPIGYNITCMFQSIFKVFDDGSSIENISLSSQHKNNS